MSLEGTTNHQRSLNAPIIHFHRVASASVTALWRIPSRGWMSITHRTLLHPPHAQGIKTTTIGLTMDIDTAKIKCYSWIHRWWYLSTVYSCPFLLFLTFPLIFSLLYYFYFLKKRTKMATYLLSFSSNCFLKISLHHVYRRPSVFVFTLKDGPWQKIIKLDDFLTSVLYEIRCASIKLPFCFQRLWMWIIVMDIKMQPSEIWTLKMIPISNQMRERDIALHKGVLLKFYF